MGTSVSTRETKKALLLVAFGTTVPEARRAYDHVETMTRTAWPSHEIRWAYTSGSVRRKLAAIGKKIDSPELAMARLMDEGYKDASIFSLHVVPGKEFHDLHTNVRLFASMKGGFHHLALARPLLSSHDDLLRAAKAVLTRFSDRSPDEAVLFMGHGNRRHSSDAIYSALNFVLETMDRNAFLAAVEGHPSLEEILPKLKAGGVRKILLIPFMAVAGIHAVQDMVGDGVMSWKSVLMLEGFECEAVMNGLAEYPEIVEIWLDHLREAMKASCMDAGFKSCD